MSRYFMTSDECSEEKSEGIEGRDRNLVLLCREHQGSPLPRGLFFFF